MTIEEAFEASRKMDTRDVQPEGREVADWYERADPSPTDMLYLVAYLLHDRNLIQQLWDKEHER
jgi:hypothetical protein